MPFNFFKKKIEVKEEQLKYVPLKPIEYSSMIILAWAKAVEGNIELQNWLRDNGYPELYMSIFAIYLKDESRNWLVENGYAHIMAMIHAAEGNENAAKWLLDNNFLMLHHLAKAIDHEPKSWEWLQKNGSQDLFILARSIQIVKDQIEENHNDVHSINQDF
jgi:hypothetical protein